MNGIKMAIIRLIVGAMLLVNALLVSKGYSPVDIDAVVEVAVYALAFLSFLWAWWKNNNVTIAAQKAQAQLEAFKQDGIDIINEYNEEAGDDDVIAE